MNIVILAGGTGSIALQTGLYNLLDKNIDGVDTKIIVNAYDNGLSTGAVRQVLNGNILGPSDVRKNQTTRLQLENPKSPWLKFLNIRFTVPSSEVQKFCHSCVKALEDDLNQLSADEKYLLVPNIGNRPLSSIEKTTLVKEAIDQFFSSPLASKIDYSDFSLANIIYAGFAKANNNSLRESARIMASLMGIKDNVLLNDDTSLFLGAVTKSGKRITDEGDIVSWGNLEDPFVNVFFTDAEGNDSVPVLCQEAKDALLKADLIILSTGTQWSSLIPTYASIGFKETIQKCKGEILMVMNRHPDKDSPGQGADEIVKILTDRYFPSGRLRVILDVDGHPIMNTIKDHSRIASCNSFKMVPSDLEVTSNKTHNPHLLARAVARTYFQDYINSDYFVFDYDDTLVGRGNVYPLASAFNARTVVELAAINSNPSSRVGIAICTGNSIRAIKLSSETTEYIMHGVDTKVKVYADGGVNLYNFTVTKNGQDDRVHQDLVECINKAAVFTSEQADEIISTLRENHIPLPKIENRGNAMVTIKPVDSEYRPLVVALVKKLIDFIPDVDIRTSGRTTVEIAKRNLTKADAIAHIMKNAQPNQITYVGDEFDGGNDAVIKGIPNVKCLSVDSPVKTAFFLLTIRNGAN